MMASRGSALRRRLESLLDDAPRPRLRVRPWLAVMALAVPPVCLAPVVTIASLSRVPAAAVRLVRQTPASEAPALRAVPVPVRADPPRAARSSKTPVAAPITATTDRTAVLEMPLDEPPATTPDSMVAGAVLESEAAPASPPTLLRDAIAAARITPEPAPSRTRLYVPDRTGRATSWFAHVGFDTTRPKLDVPNPVRSALSRAQQIAFDTTHQK